MRWLLVSLFIVQSLSWIHAATHKKVKILVPMPVQHIHHTKVVKVPEYHHYFHDRKQQSHSHQKRYNSFNSYTPSPASSASSAPDQGDYESYHDKDPALYDDANYFQPFHNGIYNDFDMFQEGGFHDRRHTPSLPPQKYFAAWTNQSGSKRHGLGPPRPPNGGRKKSYEAQHFYHRV